MNILLKIKKHIAAHKVLSIIIGVIVLMIFYFIYKKIHPATVATQYVYSQVRRSDLVISVSGSGQVATLSQVDIKPNTTGQAQSLGQIVSVRVNNGDTVKAGQVIAILDGKNALQVLNQAKSSAEIAQVNYNKLINGPTELDLLTLKNSIENGEISLENAKMNIGIKLTSAYDTFSNLVYLNTDPFFQYPLSTDPHIYLANVTFDQGQLSVSINAERVEIGDILNAWKAKLTVSSDPLQSLNDALITLTKARKYFDDMTMLFGSFSTGIDTTARTLITTDKGIAASAKSSVDSLITDITSTMQSYTSTKITLDQNKTTLSLKTAPANNDDLTVVRAQLNNANANLSNAQANYDSRIITAPFDGQIGGLTAQIGQQISSNDVLGKIITAQKVINISLNEVDAAKIGLNNTVILTFDALPDTTIHGHVLYIDPLGSVSQGVVSYGIRVALDEQNEQIKTGMTASADISTVKHENTLVVPSSAIKTIGTKKFIMVTGTSLKKISSSTTMRENRYGMSTSTFMYGSSTRKIRKDVTFSSSTIAESDLKQVEVIVGISNGIDTEILSGLEEGDVIVAKTSATKAAGAAATTANANPFNKITGGANRVAR